MIQIDDPEDPRLLAIHSKRLIQRDIDQLLGICEFALQDGHIDQGEAEAIYTWLKTHGSCLDTWPANVLFERLGVMLADKQLDQDEQREILSTIMSISQPRQTSGALAPASLPVDDPAPTILFESRSFCFTGVFDYGRRADCVDAIAKRGGKEAGGITKKLNYLVIGNIGSEVWRHTSFGSKIAKAMEYREAGVPIAIISESHWVSAIK